MSLRARYWLGSMVILLAGFKAPAALTNGPPGLPFSGRVPGTNLEVGVCSPAFRLSATGSTPKEADTLKRGLQTETPKEADTLKRGGTNRVGGRGGAGGD